MTHELDPEVLERRGNLELANGGGVLLFDPLARTVAQLDQLRWHRLRELAAQAPDR